MNILDVILGRTDPRRRRRNVEARQTAQRVHEHVKDAHNASRAYWEIRRLEAAARGERWPSDRDRH